MRKDDPCISVCRFDGKTGWCLGCGRAVPEIRAWRSLTPFRRKALARELPRRLERLGMAAADDVERRPPARKPVAVLLALVLALVSTMSLVPEARHAVHDAPVGRVASVVDPHVGRDRDAGHQEADALLHHAQSHAQGVMPTVAKARAVTSGAAPAFDAVNDATRSGPGSRRPFEPPRG